MKTTIKVSIIIPVFNVEKYVAKCLDSILKQTLQDIEIICVDDGSTDGSLGILHKYERKDLRVKVVAQPKSTAGNARNVGLKIARGEYIIFVDSDDYFSDNNALEILYFTAWKHQAEMVLFKAARIRNGKVTSTFGILESLDEGTIYSAESLGIHVLTLTTPAPYTKFISRDFIKKHRLVFQDTISTNDVYFTFTALVNVKRLYLLKKVFYHYNTDNSNSLTNNKNKNLFIFQEALLAVRNYLKAQDKFHGDIKKSFLRVALSVCLYNIEKAKGDDKQKLKYNYKNKFFKELGFEQAERTTFYTDHYNAYKAIMDERQPLLGAVEHVKSTLEYRLGYAVVHSKSPVAWIKLPFTLYGIVKSHRFNQAVHSVMSNIDPTYKTLPLNQYDDYQEAIKAKQHLSYRVGTKLINGFFKAFV